MGCCLHVGEGHGVAGDPGGVVDVPRARVAGVEPVLQPRQLLRLEDRATHEYIQPRQLLRAFT